MGEFIGKRVVPRHDGVWDKTKTYEPLVIVLNEADGDSYISRRDVPAGTVLTDAHYWALHSLYSQQIADAMDEIAATENRVYRRTEEAEQNVDRRADVAEKVSNDNKAALEERMDEIEVRLDANLTASTEGNADYAAEVVDARLDGNMAAFPTLGDAVRRHDAFLRSQFKPTVADCVANKPENGNLSSASAALVESNGRNIAVAYKLNYQRGPSGGNFIRGRMMIAYADYQAQYAGKKIAVQIYASSDCPVLLGFGFYENMTTPYCLMKSVSLKKGYNEFILDTASEAFLNIKTPTADPQYFMIHWCFGSYLSAHPADGEYEFHFSAYAVNEDMGKGLLLSDTVPHVLCAVNADRAASSDTANEAEHAVTADIGLKATNASAAVNTHVECIAKSLSTNKPKGILDCGIYTWAITKDTVRVSDMGFSLYLGSVEELRGRKLYLYSDEALPVDRIDMNLGSGWGNHSYSAVKSLFREHYGKYRVAEFDTLLRAVETALGVTDFTGNIYLMLYGNTDWDISSLAEGETLYNRYGVFASTEGLSCTPYADLSENSVNAGVENLVKGPGSGIAGGVLGVDGVFTWSVTAETSIRADAGFSVNLGTTEELHGRTVIIRRDETLPIEHIALNLGASWGNRSYADVEMLFTHLYGNYYAADFDAMYQRALEARALGNFEGDCYLMLYGNTAWDLSKLADGETAYNRYAVFGTVGGLVYSEWELDRLNRVAALEKQTAVLSKSMTEVEQRVKTVENSIPGTVDQSIGNVLYGKKYVSCGDSFTQGDFSGWTDENGLSGKNSPVIFDSEWNVYKTYPWWIAKRNNMTLVNEALCGSIMPLSKQYIAYRDDPDNNAQTAENYRNPFSYKRYLAIPEDADYITFWFGINDASNTNLGTIDDTTNETFYGAWNVVLEWLITNRPYAKLGIIVTTGSRDTYRAAVRQIAVKWGIPYLDMMGDDQTPVIFSRESSLGLCSKANNLRRSSFVVTSSNGHPNLEAHKYMSTFIENFLRRL